MVAGGGLSTLGPWAGRVRRKLQASRRPLFPGRAGIAARTTWARAAGLPGASAACTGAVSPALGASARAAARSAAALFESSESA